MGKISSGRRPGNLRPQLLHPILGRRIVQTSSTRSDSWNPGTWPRLTVFLSDSTGSTVKPKKSRKPSTGTRLRRRRMPLHGTEMQLTINEELGAEDVTTIGDDWFAPPESEVAAAVQNLLNLATPMDVDQAPEERSYQIFNTEEADALGPYQPLGSPITRRGKSCTWHTRRLLQSSGGWEDHPAGSLAGSSGRAYHGKNQWRTGVRMATRNRTVWGLELRISKDRSLKIMKTPELVHKIVLFCNYCLGKFVSA